MATDGDLVTEYNRAKSQAEDAWGHAEDLENEADEARAEAARLEDDVLEATRALAATGKCGRCKRDIDTTSTAVRLSLPAGVHGAGEPLSAVLCWPCAEEVGFERSVLLEACRDYGR